MGVCVHVRVPKGVRVRTRQPEGPQAEGTRTLLPVPLPPVRNGASSSQTADSDLQRAVRVDSAKG